MNRNPVAWFEIYVQDMKRAKAFYEGVFGLKLDQLESPAARSVTCGRGEGGTSGSKAT